MHTNLLGRETWEVQPVCKEMRVILARWTQRWKKAKEAALLPVLMLFHPNTSKTAAVIQAKAATKPYSLLPPSPRFDFASNVLVKQRKTTTKKRKIKKRKQFLKC